ncbi:MAG: DoxX family protein [Sphingobacteriales bacterium]|nr:MAG: DoxX family protein [Sphingobacteriales bacterium]
MVLTGALTATMYFIHPLFINAFLELGFPDYFRIELGTLKIIGAILLLLPMVPAKFKEWAYVGFAITYVSGIIAHAVVHQNATVIAPMVPLVFLVISYTYYYKLNRAR